MHTELSKKLDSFRLTYTNGTPNATIAAASNTVTSQQLEEIIRAAKVVGYEVSLAAGVLTLAPR